MMARWIEEDSDICAFLKSSRNHLCYFSAAAENPEKPSRRCKRMVC